VTDAQHTAVDLRFARIGSRTVLTRRRYRWPVVIGRVFSDPHHRGLGTLTMQNAAGTVIPGDVIRQHIEVVDGGWAAVGGQGATLVSGIPGGDVSAEDTRLYVDASSRLRFDPAPRILTAHARHRQHTEVCVETGGSAVVVDTVVLHPELTDATFGSVESTVTVRAADGALLALDAQLLDRTPVHRFTAFGTVYLIGAGFDTALTALTPALEDLTCRAEGSVYPVYTGVSDLPNAAGWAVRVAAADGGVLRTAVAAITSRLDLSAETAFQQASTRTFPAGMTFRRRKAATAGVTHTRF
jgi:urease accessory protein